MDGFQHIEEFVAAAVFEVQGRLQGLEVDFVALIEFRPAVPLEQVAQPFGLLLEALQLFYPVGPAAPPGALAEGVVVGLCSLAPVLFHLIAVVCTAFASVADIRPSPGCHCLPSTLLEMADDARLGLFK